MWMTRQKTGALIILGVLVSSLVLHLDLRAPGNQKEIIVAPSTTLRSENRSTTSQLSLNPISPSTQNSRPSSPHLIAPSPSEKPTGNVIEFEVINGQAIAYGDIILGKPDSSFQEKRGRYEAPAPKRWDKLEIPYLISPQLPNPQRVEIALNYVRQHTPIKFIPYENQPDALVFEAGTEHCYSYLGRVGGLQPIQLSADCGPQEIMHELMHALGFIHEQSRPDRNQFISINWDNIDEKYHLQFDMVSDALFEAEKGSPFDYHSIMLYSPQAFALRNDVPTMRSTAATEQISPAREGLSEEDLKRIRQAFRY